MKVSYLLPRKFKHIGLVVMIPSLLIGLVIHVQGYEPAFLDFNVPAIFIEEIFEKKQLIGTTNNNILNEIFAILIIVSSLMAAFSKEKLEDEYVSKIRLESLVWAVYVNYAVLLFSFLFIYDFDFLLVMMFNMVTVLIFFIIRFNWQISKFKKSASYA
jgi:hypothetical protein